MMVVVLTPALAIALLLAGFLARVRGSDAEKSLYDTGLVMARQLALSAEYGVFSGNREALDSLTAAIAREPGVIGVTIQDSAGKVLESRGQVVGYPTQAVIQREPKQTESDDGQALVSSAPIFQSPAVLEDFLVGQSSDAAASPPSARLLGRSVVVLTKANLIEQRNRLWLDSALIVLFVLVGGVFLAVRLSRQVTRPVIQLTDAVQRIAGGDFDARIEPDAGGAIRMLEEGVNVMARELKSATAGLEQRIAQATAELAAKTLEAERANEAKTKFLAAASHDLRQPLHAIGLYLEALRGQAVPIESRRIVEQTVKSASMLREMLDALLDISRLDAGNIKPVVVDFPVNQLLTKIQMQLEPRAAARGLALAVVPNRAVVRSDPLLLERILLNLVNNAIRYTRAGRVLVGCRRRNGLLRIEVRDTGIGIAPDKQELIFEEFSRVADTDQAGEKSTGLGLAIVNRLARLLNHPVAVQSVPGRGSMFVITVPWVAAQAATADAVQPAPSVASLLGTRVLVIDDDADVRTAMQTTLESWGCEVATAASGNEALARFTESGAHPPHVVISDYRLSGTETGIQALGHLRALSPQGWFGVVVTGDIAPEVAEAARRYDYPVMRKPVPPARLRALLAHYAQLRRSAQHDDGQSGSG